MLEHQRAQSVKGKVGEAEADVDAVGGAGAAAARLAVADRVDGQVDALVRDPRKHGRDPEGTFAAATAGGGGAMPYATEMGLAFGEDFSSVNAHVGRAGEMRELGAAAATNGSSVAFADANPSRGVVAHELAHVVQSRRAGGAGVAMKSLVSQPEHASEREADRAADQVAAGAPVGISQPLTSSINLLTEEEAQATTGKTVKPEQEKDFKSFVRRAKNMSYEGAIAEMKSIDELQVLIDQFLASGGGPESWWGMGMRYASNALPQLGMGAAMGLGGALVTAPFTGGLSLLALGTGMAIGGASSVTSSVTRDAALDAGASDRTANLASLAAGSFTGGAAGGLAKNGMKNILTSGLRAGLTQGATQAAVQLGVGGICELAKAGVNTNEGTKEYANTINELLGSAMNTYASGGSMNVAGVRAAFGAVRGLILDGKAEEVLKLKLTPAKQKALIAGLGLIEQATTSAVQSAEQRRAGDESDLDRQERQRKEATSEPDEVVHPTVGADDEHQAAPKPAAQEHVEAPPQPQPVVDATDESAAKPRTIKLPGDRELTVGGGKGIGFRGRKWQWSAGGDDGAYVERSATNEAGDNDSRSLSLGGGKGAEFVSAQTKATGETDITRVGAGGGDGVRVERSHGTETADVAHSRYAMGGGAAASHEAEHIHAGGVESSKTAVLPHGTTPDGAFHGALGSSESHSADMVGNSKTSKVSVLPVSAQRDGNTRRADAALMRTSETTTSADGNSQTVNADLLPVSGSVTHDQTPKGRTIGGSVDGSVAAIKIAQTAPDGAHSTKQVKLMPVSASAEASRQTADDGTVTHAGKAQGSIAVSSLESADQSADGKAHANTKVVVGEHAAHGEAQHRREANGDVEATASAGRRFTAMRGHQKVVNADGSSSETGGVFGQTEMTGYASHTSTADGTMTHAGGSIRNTGLKGATQQTNADTSSSSKSVTLGEWERGGEAWAETDADGMRVNGQASQKRTIVTAADSTTSKDGVTHGRSVTGGQSSTAVDGSVDVAPTGVTVRGNGTQRDTKFKYATSRVGVDGEKTTTGLTIGDSALEGRGKVIVDGGGVHGRGEVVDKSTDIRADESHTTAGGVRVDSEQVYGESTRTIKGTAEVDPQLRPVVDGSHESKSTKYRVGGTGSTAEKDLPGGVKGQVRVETGVEDASSEKTTFRLDGSGHQSQTTQGPSGTRTWADAKAILKNKQGKIICVVSVDLKDEQTREAANYAATTIRSWIDKVRGLPAPAPGKPVETVIDEEDDLDEREDGEAHGEVEAQPERAQPEATAEKPPAAIMNTPMWRAGQAYRVGAFNPMLFGALGPFGPFGINRGLYAAMMRPQPAPQAVSTASTTGDVLDVDAAAGLPALEPEADAVEPAVIHAPPTVAPTAATVTPNVEDKPPVELAHAVDHGNDPAKKPTPKPARGRITTMADLLREQPQEQAAQGATQATSASKPASKPGRIHSFAELMAQSSTSNDADDRGGSRNVVMETENGSRSVTVGGSGGMGGLGAPKKKRDDDWLNTPGRRVGDGPIDPARAERLAVNRRLERMLPKGTPPNGVAHAPTAAAEPLVGGTGPHGKKVGGDGTTDWNHVLEAQRKHAEAGSKPSIVAEAPEKAGPLIEPRVGTRGERMIGGTGPDGVRLGGNGASDPLHVQEAIDLRKARGLAPTVVDAPAPAEPLVGTGPNGQRVGGTGTSDPLHVQETIARRAALGLAPTVVDAPPGTAALVGGTGAHGAKVGGDGASDPLHVQEAIARRKAAGLAPTVVDAPTAKAELVGGTGPEGTKLGSSPRRVGNDEEIEKMFAARRESLESGPGQVEHVGASCYVASILNLFAANPDYLNLLDAGANPAVANTPKHRLQAALAAAAQMVKAGTKVDAHTVAHAIHVLASLGYIAVPRDGDPVMYQQDAAEVFSRILAALDSNDQFAVDRTERTRRIDGRTGETTRTALPIVSATTSHVLPVNVTSRDRTLAGAILQTYGQVHRPDVRDATIERTDTVDSMPNTLTIVLERADYGHEIEISPVVEIPAGALGGAAADAGVVRYRVSAIVNHDGDAGGGHYVASSRHEGRWRRNDDMKPMPAAAQRAPTTDDVKTARMITLQRI